MSDAVKSAGNSLWEWRVAIAWCFLFSFNALGTAYMAAFTGVEWGSLDTQQKITIMVAIFVNWSSTMMAFISQQAKRIQQTGTVFPTGDTTFIPKPTNPAPTGAPKGH